MINNQPIRTATYFIHSGGKNMKKRIISVALFLSIFMALFVNNTCYAAIVVDTNGIIPTINDKISYQDISSEEDYQNNNNIISNNGTIDNYIVNVNTESKSLLLGDTQKNTLVFFSGERFVLSSEKLWYTNLDGETAYYALSDIPENSISNAILMVFAPNSNHTSLNVSVNNNK